MIVLICAILPLTLLLFSSVMSYVLLLLLIVVLILSLTSFYYTLSTLLTLVIMTVYIGAIITLFVYVSAVSPNDYVQSDKYLGVSFLVICLFSLAVSSVSLSFNSLEALSFQPTSVEIFSGSGVYLSLLLTLVLLIVLLVSTYSTPSLSIFRALK